MFSILTLFVIKYCLLIFTQAQLSDNSSNLFEINVVHVNDFHARYEETNSQGSACKEDDVCIGGYSRLYHQIFSMLKENRESFVLNAGDNFQGTLWYNIGKWNVSQEFVNKLPYSAVTIGNHEFDDGLPGLIPYLQRLKHPVVLANIDDSLEPSIQGLYSKSIVVERSGKKIGIIGVLRSDTPELAYTGKLKFLDESPSVNEEAERLVREEGVFTNIVLSHAGYERDQIMAANASGKIGLIVGGHTHVFLYAGNDLPGPDEPKGPYPTIINNNSGNKVLIVQASSYCRYLGNITVWYDENGEIIHWNGAPIYLDSSVPQDLEINQDLRIWKEYVDQIGKFKVGNTLGSLDYTKCKYAECTLGNFVADAMVHEYILKKENNNSWTYASISIINCNGLRTSISRGDITYADLVAATPFGVTVDIGEIQGKYIKEMLEFNSEPTKLFQYSGMQVKFNLSNPKGSRVVLAKIRCQNCKIPKYEDLDLEKIYRLVLPSWVRIGGEGFHMISENIKNVQEGRQDLDVFIDYLAAKDPVFVEEEGRIIFV